MVPLYIDSHLMAVEGSGHLLTRNFSLVVAGGDTVCRTVTSACIAEVKS